MKVGTVIATLSGEGEEPATAGAPVSEAAVEPAAAGKAEESDALLQHKTGARQMHDAAKYDAEVTDPTISQGAEMVKNSVREARRDGMAEEMRKAASDDRRPLLL